jgi:hypothetical protein
VIEALVVLCLQNSAVAVVGSLVQKNVKEAETLYLLLD